MKKKKSYEEITKKKKLTNFMQLKVDIFGKILTVISKINE